MITKEYITELKKRNNGDISTLVNARRDVGSINFILESLGQLPENFKSDFLYNLLNHQQHAQVRLNAVKNIGNHPNEMVRTVIYKEYFAKEKNK